ncbi:MAG: Cof-type HAD-IIB family hydrolase [Christensenellales bacterium]
MKPVIRAIAFDLDDTLLRDDRTISDETVSVLRRASEAGILILPASGRTYCSMAGFAKRIGCASRVICANGAVIAQPDGTTLHELTIPADIARQVARFAKERGCYCQTYAGDCFYYNQQGDYARAYAESSSLRGVYVGDLEQHLSAPTTKLLMMAPPEQSCADAGGGTSAVRRVRRADLLEAILSGVNPPLATKGHALSVCAEEMGFPLSQCMAFGDSLNDVSMLRAAGYGVCMGNGREDVKRMGFAVCGTNQEDGVARYIQRILFD